MTDTIGNGMNMFSVSDDNELFVRRPCTLGGGMVLIGAMMVNQSNVFSEKCSGEIVLCSVKDIGPLQPPNMYLLSRLAGDEAVCSELCSRNF